MTTWEKLMLRIGGPILVAIVLAVGERVWTAFTSLSLLQYQMTEMQKSMDRNDKRIDDLVRFRTSMYPAPKKVGP